MLSEDSECQVSNTCINININGEPIESAPIPVFCSISLGLHNTYVCQCSGLMDSDLRPHKFKFKRSDGYTGAQIKTHEHKTQPQPQARIDIIININI